MRVSSFIYMDMTGKKTSLKPAVTAKNSNATNLTRRFKGESSSLSAV